MKSRKLSEKMSLTKRNEEERGREEKQTRIRKSDGGAGTHRKRGQKKEWKKERYERSGFPAMSRERK